MNDEAARRLAKARRLLDQIARLDAAALPEPVIHAAYYAMFHAATAVLIAREGTAPATHSALIGRFSQLARAEGGTARDHGRALNRAFDLRSGSPPITAPNRPGSRTSPRTSCATRTPSSGFAPGCAKTKPLDPARRTVRSRDCRPYAKPVDRAPAAA